MFRAVAHRQQILRSADLYLGEEQEARQACPSLTWFDNAGEAQTLLYWETAAGQPASGSISFPDRVPGWPTLFIA